MNRCSNYFIVLSIYVFMYAHGVCVCVVWYVYWGRILVQKPEEDVGWMFCFIVLHLIPLREGLSLHLKLDWQLAIPSNPPVSTPSLHNSEIIGTYIINK